MSNGKNIPDSLRMLLSVIIVLAKSITFGQAGGQSGEVADATRIAYKKDLYQMSLEELGNLRLSLFDVVTSLDKGYRAFTLAVKI